MNEERYEELTQELIQTIGKMRKELLVTRIFNGILTGMLVVVLVVGGICMHKVQQYGEELVEYAGLIEDYLVEVEPILDELAKVDVEAINEAVESFDVESLNAAIDEIDFESLGDTIDRMDSILDSLDGASEKLQEVTSTVGDFFGWSDREEE
ncbi:MAG: hypothetical protein E7292_02075 [Lachnospiraceae bacterium]|nr:hypothetical protein [Lachnospiraceae bacterium]